MRDEDKKRMVEEIHRLIDERFAALQGSLMHAEAMAVAEGKRRIEELLKRLTE